VRAHVCIIVAVAQRHNILNAKANITTTNVALSLKAMNPQPNRSNLFITTKIHAGSGSVADCAADPTIAMRSVEQSLKNLKVDYLDLVLLHRPCQQVQQVSFAWLHACAVCEI